MFVLVVHPGENFGNFNLVGSMFRPATSVDDMMALVGANSPPARLEVLRFGVRRLIEVSSTGRNSERARTCKVSSSRTRKVRASP
jgi:hypothetical protein